jgi:hypothetical protein
MKHIVGVLHHIVRVGIAMMLKDAKATPIIVLKRFMLGSLVEVIYRNRTESINHE